MADHRAFMREALAQARLCAGDVPVGAVMVHGGVVIARAHNEREQGAAPLAHAEMLVIARAAQALGARRLDGCTLYVTLEPCPMCAGALIMAGVSRLVFGAFDRQYGCCGSVYALPLDPAFNHTLPCIGGILEEECAALLADFFAARRGGAQPSAQV